MEIKKDILWRVYLCFIGIAFLGLCVLGRAFYVQQAEGEFWLDVSKKDHLKYFPVEAERGSIYSEDGNMLSTSVPIFDVFVDFSADGLRAKGGKRLKENIDSLSICLANLFKDKTHLQYKKELQLGYKERLRYYSLKKKISFDEYCQLRNFPLVKLGKNKSGFIIDTRDKRINPYVLFANRTIGLSRENSKKNVGLELTYDSLLRGVSGQRLMRYAAGTYLPVDGADLDPINGKDIVTTLDTYIQDVTQSALMKMMVNNNSTHGTAIVMEVATGKIKAIANLGKQPDGSYIEDLNYGIGRATEPGSIFKLATLISLLDDGYVTQNSIVDCEGGVKKFYGLRIKDSHLGEHEMTVKEAFFKSSNVAFAKLAYEYYNNQPDQFISHLQKFRLNQMTGIDIVASSGKPTIKTPKNRSWSKTTIPFMAHGYEELVTPLHMLMLYNAVANDGKMMRPYLVNTIKEYGVDLKKFNPEILVQKICKDATLAQVKECLKAVVDSAHGTGHRILFDSLYSISGKTGTAVSALDNKGYNKGNKIYQASFIGYFPSESPKYSIAVVIQNSRESKFIYGADVAGRVFKEISDRIYGRYIHNNKIKFAGLLTDSAAYRYAGMMKDLNAIFSFMKMNYYDSSVSGTWRNAQMVANSSALVSPGINGLPASIMPDVVGMGLKDALYLLENRGMKVSILGKGKVISQSLAAGSTVSNGQKINLMLN